MIKLNSALHKISVLVIAIVAWLALAAQFYLILLNRKYTVAVTVIQYFSYFTILSNLLVAWCCSVILYKKDTGTRHFFAAVNTITAIALYITIVGLVYNFILRFLWAPQGTQKIVDEMLHSLVPVLFLGYWLYFVPKHSLRWINAFPWLIFPFTYCVYILVRGAVTNLYPYPFMDVVTLGYLKVFINCSWLVLAFLLVALFFIATAKLLSRYQLKPNHV